MRETFDFGISYYFTPSARVHKHKNAESQNNTVLEGCAFPQLAPQGPVPSHFIP